METIAEPVTNPSTEAGENTSERPKGFLFLAPPEATFAERLSAVEKMKANLVAEGKARLEQIAATRRELDAEQAKIHDFLGLDAPAPAPEPEKKPKAARGSVRGPVLAFYRENATLPPGEGISTSVVAKQTDLDLDQVQGAAAKLAHDGLLERVGKSSYRWKAQAE